MFKPKSLARFSPSTKGHNPRNTADIDGKSNAAFHRTNRFDIFGSLPRDVQIDVLGYVAAGRPVQVLLMRKVCRRWREVLSEDSIYHSALFTASSHLPPPPVSLDAFENAAWIDDRIRRLRLSKGRIIWYTKDMPYNNNSQPSKVIYRDGFIVWWVFSGKCFRYVDLNKTKKAKESFVVDSGHEWPLYTQAGGKLIFCESCNDSGRRHLDRKLQVVFLQVPLLRGEIPLSSLADLESDGRAYELYCSGEYALVAKGLKVLVADIRDVMAARVLRIIHLDKHTALPSPAINTIEIGGKNSCLIVLTSGLVVETIIISLTSGAVLRRCSTKTLLESRRQPLGTVYHVQHNSDFARDTQYQILNPRHKNNPPLNLPNACKRWLRIPAETGAGGECVTGSYEHTPHPHQFPHPLAQHSVTFKKQAVTFTALRDTYDSADVHKLCLQITTGNVGAEKEDSDVRKTDDIYHHEIGTPIGGKRIALNWTHKARMSPPRECIGVMDDSTTYVNTEEWCRGRRAWHNYAILLGDEKALVLALPHQLVIWRFETRQMYKDRKKKRLMKLFLKGLLHTLLIPAYAGAAAGAVPIVLTIVSWNVGSHVHKKLKASEIWSKMVRGK